LVVGAPAGGAVTERLDPQRSNASNELLPTDALRILWTRQLRPMVHAPLVLEDGKVVVVTDQGDALFLNPDGTDSGHVALGPGPMSAPTLLSDGTVVAVNGLGDVVGARRMSVVLRTHVVDGSAIEDPRSPPSAGPRMQTVRRHGGRHRSSVPQMFDPPPRQRAFSLPLGDGGLVVAADRDLVCLDAGLALRNRAVAPSPVASPLVAMGSSVAFVTDTGEVFDWDLSSASGGVRRRGTLGGPVDGEVAASDDRHLFAVVRGARLVWFDLSTGAVETRATTTGTFTGTLALGPRKDGARATAFLQEVTLAGTRALEVDDQGRATPFPTLLSSQSSLGPPDAGSGQPALPEAETQLFADPSGTLAYATADGHVGVVSRSGKRELGPLPCGSPAAMMSQAAAMQMRLALGFAGLVPAGRGAFVVACEGGALTMVTGDVRAESPAGP
jgi:hypothetical protein